MNHSFLFLLAFVSFGLQVMYAQETENDSNQIIEYRTYVSQDDTSVYYVMYRSLVAVQPLTYVTFFPYFHREFEKYELRPGEGQKGYTFEAVLDNVFTLLQGRDRSKWDFLRTSRLTMDASIGMRMTEDLSRPLIPNNYKIGFGVNKSIWDSQTNWHFNPCKSANRNGYDEKKGLRSLHFQILAQHYSNGQASGFFYVDTINNLQRNDYLKGDFSTNYIRPYLMFNIHGKNKSLFSLGSGYQWDLGTDTITLAFSADQNQFYGKQRWLLFLQYRTLNTYFRHWPLELMSRAEVEYIVDDIGKFHDQHGIQQRWSGHLYLTATPIESRSLGLIMHFFYGRDYFNIRFDDVIFTAQIGLTFTMDKYYPPGITNEGKVKKMKKEIVRSKKKK